MTAGYLCFVLHAHLPFVRHPEYEQFLEESWLFEAISETYIPLLKMAKRLDEDAIPFRLTLSLSPPLLNMLMDPLLQERYKNHLLKLIELSEKEIVRTNETPTADLAKMYHEHFVECLAIWDTWESNLVRAFDHFAQLGYFELITTSATHAFLPAYRDYPEAIRAQIHIGTSYYKSLFGRETPGMWLPECGYFPGLEEILYQEGVGYFFLEHHGIKYATPLPFCGIYAPIYTPQGTAVFGRDPLTSEQVWSSKKGYPGDPNYREFYRDIGYDLDFEYIHPYIHPDGIRVNTGIKYHSITGKTNRKAIYDPEKAQQAVQAHAGDFLWKASQRFGEIDMGKPPIITAPYDAELFGHWWFEGPLWLEEIFRQCHLHHPEVLPITPTEYLKRHPTHQVSIPASSTWGKRGYNEVWIGGENSWIYQHLLHATEEMIRLVPKYQSAQGLEKRAFQQAVREVLLAQSSDWPFLMHTDTAPEYAEKRLKYHLSRFLKLLQDLEENSIDPEWLAGIEYLDNIFPQMEFFDFK